MISSSGAKTAFSMLRETSLVSSAWTTLKGMVRPATKIKYDWVSPDYFVCLNAGGNGSIKINGGSFTAKGGYGYKKEADATITFGVSNPASLFKVKKLELK